jgi:hypothetical protein
LRPVRGCIVGKNDQLLDLSWRASLKVDIRRPSLGFSNMTPQEAISSEWLTWYSQGGGVETKFFEDAVATLRRLRTGLRIKALKIVSLAGQTESAVGVQLEHLSYVR